MPSIEGYAPAASLSLSIARSPVAVVNGGDRADVVRKDRPIPT